MKKSPKALSKSSLYLQIINVNSTLFGTVETLGHSFKLKIMPNTTAALFYEDNCPYGENYVGESVRKPILRWARQEDPNKHSEPAKHLKYFPDHQFERKSTD